MLKLADELYTEKNYSVFYSVLLLNSTANNCFRNLQWIAVILYIYLRQILFFFLQCKL